MNFVQAVQTCLTKYAVFNGRARRPEYWYFFLFDIIVGIVAAVVDAAIGSPILGIIITLAFLLPGLGVGARRLHDTGRSGWWQLIALIPIIGVIVLIVFLAQDSSPNGDRYGSPA